MTLLELVSTGSPCECTRRKQCAGVSERRSWHNLRQLSSGSKEGGSPHPQAPPFRTLSSHYPVEDLAQSHSLEGIVSGHPDMPIFVLEPYKTCRRSSTICSPSRRRRSRLTASQPPLRATSTSPAQLLLLAGRKSAPPTQSMKGATILDQRCCVFRLAQRSRTRLKSLRCRKLNLMSFHKATASIPSKSLITSSTRTWPCRLMKASSFVGYSVKLLCRDAALEDDFDCLRVVVFPVGKHGVPP